MREKAPKGCVTVADRGIDMSGNIERTCSFSQGVGVTGDWRPDLPFTLRQAKPIWGGRFSNRPYRRGLIHASGVGMQGWEWIREWNSRHIGNALR